MAIKVQVTFDCAAPGTLAEFWAAALGYELEPPPPPYQSWPECLSAWGIPEELWDSRCAVRDPDGVGPRLFFQQVPEAKSVKNRLHLDLRAAEGLTGDDRMTALAARAVELEQLGAQVQRRVEPADGMGAAGFIVMHDPEGNEFCLD